VLQLNLSTINDDFTLSAALDPLVVLLLLLLPREQHLEVALRHLPLLGPIIGEMKHYLILTHHRPSSPRHRH